MDTTPVPPDDLSADPDVVPVNLPAQPAQTPAVALPIAGCEATTPTGMAKLSGVWIAPGGEVWVVGDDGLVGRRSGDRAWAWCRPLAGASYRAVWGSADDDVWMVGANGLVLRHDGAAFAQIDVGTTATLEAIWGSSVDDIFIVGTEGVIRHSETHGDTWRNADLAPEHRLLGVWGARAGDVRAVGESHHQTPDGLSHCEAEIHRWNPATSSFAPEAAFPIDHGGCAFNGISGSDTGEVWAVGTMYPAGAAVGYAFSARFDGATWQADVPPEELRGDDRRFTDVAVDAPGAPDGLWMTSTAMPALRKEGQTWTAADPVATGLLDIDVRGEQMFAVGEDGRIVRWQDTRWVLEN